MPTELENTREYKAAKALEDALNSTTWSSEKFAQAIMTMHPYLQSTLFRTMRSIIHKMGDPDRYVDGRNEHTKEISQVIIESTKDIW